MSLRASMPDVREVFWSAVPSATCISISSKARYRVNFANPFFLTVFSVRLGFQRVSGAWDWDRRIESYVWGVARSSLES